MTADWKDRLRFYQELGFDTLYRRRADDVAGAKATPPPTGSHPERNASGGGVPQAVSLLQVMAQGMESPAVHPPALAASPETLAEIQADLGDCRRCKLHEGRHNIVFGSGNPHAEVVFVGEGPGADEDAQGLPFVGRAGQLLTEMINKSAERMNVPLRREHVYICNVVKCRPPGNRPPEKIEIDTCSPFLLRQIEAIRPRAIVALGATAARALLKSGEAMGRLRGRWFDFRGSRLLVTYHPAYLLRDPSKKRETWEDMQMLLRFLYDTA